MAAKGGIVMAEEEKFLMSGQVSKMLNVTPMTLRRCVHKVKIW